MSKRNSPAPGSDPYRRYRISFVIDGLSMGGAERLLVPILKSLSREYFDTYVCAIQSKDGNPLADEIRALGVRVDCLNLKYLRDISALPRLIGYLREIGADLVHTQLEFSNILGNLAAWLMGLPSVSTIHVLPSLEVDRKARLHQRAEWLALHHFCDHVIAVSEVAKQHHLAVSGASPARISTIHNGIDLSSFQNLDRTRARIEVREEFGIPAYSNLLLTIAVLRPQKGIQYMIRAMPAILASSPDTHYLIVGAGDHQAALMDEASGMKLDRRVIFAGMRSDILRLLAGSDAFILPTLTEALPTVLAEAMAAKLPIVASRVGGVPEMVSDGKNGYLIMPEDVDGLAEACVRLMADPARRAAMGGAGWEIVQNQFDVQQQAEQLRQLYLRHLKARAV